MGRKKLWGERMHLTLPAGAKERIDGVLLEGEDRLELIRTAIEKEVRSRTRKARLSGPAGSEDDGSHGDTDD